MADDNTTPKKNPRVTRREFMAHGVRAAGVLCLGSALGAFVARPGEAQPLRWQIDVAKCVRCGKCATECVLRQSAVKCVHSPTICGYCKICFGYYKDTRVSQDATWNREDQRCPTDAIKRTGVVEPYFEYEIDEDKCIGCGLCVDGCMLHGNGSMQLQIVHDTCVNCNQCRIAVECPAQAISRVPADKAYGYRKASRKPKADEKPDGKKS